MLLLLYFLSLCVALVTAIALPSSTATRPGPKSTTILLNQTYVNTLSRRQDDVYLQGYPNYFGPVTIGSGGSGDVLQLLFDTGSTPLVVSQDALPSDPSIQDTGMFCQQNYGSGGRVSCEGTWHTAPYSFSQFSANNQLCVCTFSGDNGAFGDGILGMGFALGTGERSPLYQFQGVAGLVSFSVYLSTDPNGGGAFTPNDYDPIYLQEDATFASESVDSSYGEWSFSVDHFEYEGESYTLGFSDGFVDTGNPTINVSPDAASTIWRLTGADPTTGSYGGNCDPGGNPVTIVSSSGNRYDIEAVHYVLGPNANGICHSAFQAATGDHMVIGAPFIRQYYTYFDVANSQIEFAQSSG